jgi:DNA-binding IclR family transcriptional regulator
MEDVWGVPRVANEDNADVAASTPTQKAVPAVTRAVAILRLLSSSKTPLGVNMIATRLNLVPSTCLHILRVLVAEELVAMDPQTKQYTLEAGILTLARRYLRSSSFGQRVQPDLEDFVTRFPVTALAARVVNLDHMVVVATARARSAVHINVELGSRQPSLMSATGRCLAAFGQYSPRQIEKRFDQLRWDIAPSRETWLAEVEDARRHFFSVDKGNYMRGVTVIAAPVLDAADAMTHVVVALGFSEEVAAAGITRIGTELRSLAAKLETARSV